MVRATTQFRLRPPVPCFRKCAGRRGRGRRRRGRLLAKRGRHRLLSPQFFRGATDLMSRIPFPSFDLAGPASLPGRISRGGGQAFAQTETIRAPATDPGQKETRLEGSSDKKPRRSSRQVVLVGQGCRARFFHHGGQNFALVSGTSTPVWGALCLSTNLYWRCRKAGWRRGPELWVMLLKAR